MTQHKIDGKIRATALGRFVGILPGVFHAGKWLVILFDASGRFSSSGVCDSEQEAKKMRKRIFALHKKRFAERRARRRKP